MNKLGTIKLETDRLILRRFKKEDAEAMFENWTNNPYVHKYLSYEPHKSLEATKKTLNSWLKKYDENNENTYKWGIELKENGKLIGLIKVMNHAYSAQSCEIGYILSKSEWGKGIMTEALSRVLDFLFNDVEFYLVHARHIKRNIASEKVLNKNGFSIVASLPLFGVYRESGKRDDMIIHSINKDEYNLLKNK